eukprot:scaffold8352_cov135-Skeletonema_dohrnii-CCMP3373.AAC.2
MAPCRKLRNRGLQRGRRQRLHQHGGGRVVWTDGQTGISVEFWVVYLFSFFAVSQEEYITTQPSTSTELNLNRASFSTMIIGIIRVAAALLLTPLTQRHLQPFAQPAPTQRMKSNSSFSALKRTH